LIIECIDHALTINLKIISDLLKPGIMTKQIKNTGLFAAILFASLFLFPAFQVPAQTEATKNVVHTETPSLLGFAMGVSGMGMENWKAFLGDYENELPNVSETRYNDNGFLFDLFLKVKVRKNLAVGFSYQSLSNKMSIQYYDNTNLSVIQIFMLQGYRVVHLKTSTVLFLPTFSWYIPDKLPNFYPFLQVACGMGSSKISLTNDIMGRGQGLAASGSAGFEAGWRIFLFHARAGYRYLRPKMSYSRSILDCERLCVDLSGFFVNLGMGLKLNPTKRN
jgi:hypothetical protein